MKVLVQNPFMNAGGAEVRIQLLLGHLTRRKDVEEIHFMTLGEPAVHNVQANGKMHLWQVKPGLVKKITENIINDFDVNVVQLHNNLGIGTAGLKLAQEMGIPTVYVMHDFWTLCPQLFFTRVFQAMDYPICYNIYDSNKEPKGNESECRQCVGNAKFEVTQINREVINNCDAGVVPSQQIADIFEDNNVLRGRWNIVKPWVNVDLFKPDPSVRKNHMQVFFAGNFIPHKGVQVLLKAWDIVQRNLPMAVLKIQGDNRCLPQTIGLKESLRLSNVQLIQKMPQERLMKIYNESALTVFPSIWEETIGLIWLESLLCGTPVLCSRTGSIPELLNKGGDMFEPRNHVELAWKIIDMLLSPDKRDTIGREGMEYVYKNYNPPRAAEDFMRIYNKLQVSKNE